MYYTKKICECGFERKFDSDMDTFGIKNYKYCPYCRRKLKTVGYSPDI